MAKRNNKENRIDFVTTSSGGGLGRYGDDHVTHETHATEVTTPEAEFKPVAVPQREEPAEKAESTTVGDPEELLSKEEPKTDESHLQHIAKEQEEVEDPKIELQQQSTEEEEVEPEARKAPVKPRGFAKASPKFKKIDKKEDPEDSEKTIARHTIDKK